MEIFQKYKKVGLEKHIQNIKNISIPLIIKGQKNVGKTQLIKSSFTTAMFCDTIDDIPEKCNGYYYNTICLRNIDKLSKHNQKQLCSHIDKFQNVVRFIFTANTTNMIDALISRSCFYNLFPPTNLEIQQNIGDIICSENLDTNINNFYGKTYHTILIELTLLKHGKSCDIIYSELYQCKYIMENLKTLSYEDIRKLLYELYLKQTSMNEILKIMCKLLIQQNTNDKELCFYISQKAAHYEHQMCLGNKEIYHLEAFVFGIKNRILCNVI